MGLYKAQVAWTSKRAWAGELRMRSRRVLFRPNAGELEMKEEETIGPLHSEKQTEEVALSCPSMQSHVLADKPESVTEKTEASWLNQAQKTSSIGMPDSCKTGKTKTESIQNIS